MPDISRTVTYKEIMSQPETWSTLMAAFPLQEHRVTKLMESLWAMGDRASVLVTGCGTAYALALCIASVFRHYGVAASALPASEVAFYPDQVQGTPNVLIAVSRSGMSSETLWALDAFRKTFPGQTAMALTTRPRSPLGSRVDVVLDASAAQEQAVPETRSFTGMLILAQAFIAQSAGDQACSDKLRSIPSALHGKLPSYLRIAEDIAKKEAITRFFFLGGGALYGIALEGMFKIKEYAGGWAEAYHPLEFRHGPRVAANVEALVVGILSDRQAEAEVRLLNEMRDQGACTLAIAPDDCSAQLPEVDYVARVPGILTEWERGALCCPLLQLIGLFQAGKYNLDPDQPTSLRAVTQL